MIKAKQPINKIKSSVVRKPSLPIKRTSSVQSNYSDQSCMSDRITYKKSLPQQPSNRNLEHNQSKNYVSNATEQQRVQASNPSQKNLSRIKNKLSVGTEIKKQQHQLTAFQWLIVMRHCFHIQNKRRSANCIKQRTLVNYIRNKMYPDSLWNKILVLENEAKISASSIVYTVQKQYKCKYTLDDILLCISKYFISHHHHQQHTQQDHESAAETARFTDNMKHTLENKSSAQLQPSHSQPKFIYKKLQSKQKALAIKQPTKPAQVPIGHNNKKQRAKLIDQISTVDINSFVDSQIGLNISPISITNQTNNISFSLDQSQQSQSNFRSLSPKSIQQRQDRFESAFNGIRSLKQSLQNSSKAREQKSYIISFLQEILSYCLYKNKQRRPTTKQTTSQSQSHLKSTLLLEETQYFYGIKLQSRNSIAKIPVQIMQRFFGSRQFTQYFSNLQAIKISQYYDDLPLVIPVLSNNLRILNLSNNNLRSVSFVKDLSVANLQFINLNSNKLANISDLLSLQKLQEVHVRNNMIDHVISDKVQAKGLRIIDLGNNLIQKQQDIFSLNCLLNLRMVNLSGNAILNSFKSNGFLAKEVIVDHSEMYIFSSFTQYKDIAFGAKQKDPINENKTQRNQSVSDKQNKI